MVKTNLENEIKELKTNLKFVSKQLEKAYDKNSELRIENYELKKKLNLIPPKSISESKI